MHFLCGHSFHQRCLGENEECAKCAPEARAVLELRAQVRAGGGAEAQDRFFQSLRNSDDGFAVVAEHFARGLFAAGP